MPTVHPDPSAPAGRGTNELVELGGMVVDETVVLDDGVGGSGREVVVGSVVDGGRGVVVVDDAGPLVVVMTVEAEVAVSTAEEHDPTTNNTTAAANTERVPTSVILRTVSHPHVLPSSPWPTVPRRPYVPMWAG